MKPERVHIVGGAGSGKTTLAREFSRRNGVPHYELDDIMWANAAERTPRSDDERDRLLQESIDSELWVIDGIFWQEWVVPSFERAEKIIVLDVPERTRHWRVIARHFKLLLVADRSDYRFFFPTLLELIKLNRNYRRGPYQKTLDAVARFKEKVVICATCDEAASELCL